MEPSPGEDFTCIPEPNAVARFWEMVRPMPADYFLDFVKEDLGEESVCCSNMLKMSFIVSLSIPMPLSETRNLTAGIDFNESRERILLGRTVSFIQPVVVNF